MPAAKRRGGARAPHTPSRSRPRPIALLILGPLLCVLALTSLGYVGLSQQARQDTQAQIGMAAQAAHGILMENMGGVKITNGQLTSDLPATITSLNNNNAETQRLQAQVGMDILIVEREKGDTVVVASSLAGSRAGAAPLGLGERLTGPIATSVCSMQSDRPTTGTLTLAGTDFIAGSVPLVDSAGACVGAVVALKSPNGLMTVPMEYTVILAMAGALLSLLTVAIGLALHGRGDSAGEAERLRAALTSLDAAEVACETQMAQREWISRRLDAGRQRLHHALTTLAVDRMALQDATSDIWAGVSQPGAPIDPATALRLAREGAVVAARVGSRLDDFDTIADTLFTDLEVADEVDAQLDDALARTEEAIAAVRAAVGAAPEATAAATQSAPIKRPTAPGDLYATNLMDAQRRRADQARAASSAATPRQTGGYRAVRPDLPQQRAMGGWGATGYTPAPGQTPRPRPSNGMGASGMYPQQGMPGASGVYRQQGTPGASGQYRSPNNPQPPRQTPRPAPRQQPDSPPDGRDRDSSGSRWLND